MIVLISQIAEIAQQHILELLVFDAKHLQILAGERRQLTESQTTRCDFLQNFIGQIVIGNDQPETRVETVENDILVTMRWNRESQFQSALLLSLSELGTFLHCFENSNTIHNKNARKKIRQLTGDFAPSLPSFSSSISAKSNSDVLLD